MSGRRNGRRLDYLNLSEGRLKSLWIVIGVPLGRQKTEDNLKSLEESFIGDQESGR